MKKLWITLAALLMSAQASATVICAGCEYSEGAGSFLGAFDSVRGDIATFQNSEVGISTFSDFWVFDVSPAALGSVSADFTLLTSLGNFVGELYRDAGSVCSDFNCTAIALGPLIASADAFANRWEIVEFFTPDRYVLRIGGVPNLRNQGTYTGQMSFLAFTIPIREAGTLGLLGLGLIGFALLTRWKKGTLK